MCTTGCPILHITISYLQTNTLKLPEHHVPNVMARGEIIIPNEKPEAEHVIQNACQTLNEQFGGHSRYEGVGSWKTDDGTVNEEHIKLSVSDENIDEIEQRLRDIAKTVKSELDEDAVMIETIDFETVFV